MLLAGSLLHGTAAAEEESHGASASFSATNAKSNVDDSNAEVLFQRGLGLLEAQNFIEACPLLEQSLALERALGTLLNLGRCYELTARPASALQMYESAVEIAKLGSDSRRLSLARTRREAADRAAPKVLIILPDGGNQLQVAIDGRGYEIDVLRQPLRLDPGTHTIEMTRDGDDEPYQASVSVLAPDPKAASTVAMVTLGLPARRSPEPLHQASVTTQPTACEKSSEEPVVSRAPLEDTHGSQAGARLFAWGGLVTGLAAFGTGVALGVDAYSKAAGSDCDDNLVCSPEGLEQRQSAQEQLGVSYAIGISGGAVAIVSGLFIALLQKGNPAGEKNQSALHPSAYFDEQKLNISFSGRF